MEGNSKMIILARSYICYMKKALVLLAVCALFISTASAQNPYEAKTFTSSEGQSINYRELTPAEIVKGKKYPLVVFMHGAGERGDDNKAQLQHGSQMFMNPVNREKHPSFVIFPQCPKDKYWAYSGRPTTLTDLKAEAKATPLTIAIKELIDSYLENPSIDPSRIYIMGLSMGGMATYDMVSRYPELFAAAIPICGAADTEKITTIKGVKWRIYHGDADDIVPVDCSRRAFQALKAAGADVEYFEFPGCNHLSWNPAFNQEGFLDWLYAQKKAKCGKRK
jgi:predicted peptidase